MMDNVQKMTDEELADEISDYQWEIDFWSVDLASPDNDVVAEARRFIRIAKQRLNELQAEIKRRKGVTE